MNDQHKIAFLISRKTWWSSYTKWHFPLTALRLLDQLEIKAVINAGILVVDRLENASRILSFVHLFFLIRSLVFVWHWCVCGSLFQALF